MVFVRNANTNANFEPEKRLKFTINIWIIIFYHIWGKDSLSFEKWPSKLEKCIDKASS